jgi:hypothetical protein
MSRFSQPSQARLVTDDKKDRSEWNPCGRRTLNCMNAAALPPLCIFLTVARIEEWVPRRTVRSGRPIRLPPIAVASVAKDLDKVLILLDRGPV